jgi:hypothetical protein
MTAARITLVLSLFAALAVTGCGHSRVAVEGTPEAVEPSPTPTPFEPLLLSNAAAYQEIPTYDGSGQTVHPDIAYFPDGWHGYKYWMASTPYPYDTDTRENPSIVVSNDGLSWTVPPGLSNPLVPPPACDHNNDPDIVYNPQTDELYVYYVELMRSSRCGSVNENNIRLLKSADGVNWSGPETVMSWDLSTNPIYLSPAVVYREGAFAVWMAIPDGAVVHATSNDGVHWSSVKPVTLAASPWHLDVQYVGGEYWMLFVDSPVAGSNLRLARSRDGLSWDVQTAPVLTPGADWENDRIYRSTFVYDDAAKRVRVWYSARSTAGQWHVGYAEGNR